MLLVMVMKMNTKKYFIVGIMFMLAVFLNSINVNAVASGGTITTDGAYAVHTFLSNGSFNITSNILNATILVVAGGGGGAIQGGGGAGGLLYISGINITANQPVIVGGGGTYNAANQGGNGFNSSFMTYMAKGGGGGGGYTTTSALNGGSGGGAAAVSSAKGLGLVGQGYDGSECSQYTGEPYPAGAGGGSGMAASTCGSANTGGNGGNGTNINITGVFTYYAGGGGGGTSSFAGNGGNGGNGGGGNGTGGAKNGTNGVNGLGGGGGGGSYAANNHGGSGGSGIVIIRYLNVTPEIIYPASVNISHISDMQINTTQLIDWSNSSGGVIVHYNVTLSYENDTPARNLGISYTSEYSFTPTDLVGYFYVNVTATNSEGQISNSSKSNVFNISAICDTPVFACTDFGSCGINNITECLAVTDMECSILFNGTLSDYNANCTYVPMGSVDWLNFDLANSNNAFIFGVFVFLWLGLAVMSFLFRNIFIAGMMFIVGIGLGFMVVSISMVLSLMFLFMSTMLFMKFNGGD